jgi:Helix-turn-helix domain
MKPNKTRISRIQSKWVTKKVKTTVPPGQQAAMQASYLLGKSIRQIAREMHRDPATVSKIVKSAQMDGIVLDMKEKFFGKLLPRALQSVLFALDEETNGQLGYQVMKDAGVVPNQNEILEERALGGRRTTPASGSSRNFMLAFSKTEGTVLRCANFRCL